MPLLEAAEQGRVTALCWRTESQLSGLEARCLRALTAWADAWTLSIGGLQCRNAWQVQEAVAGSIQWRPLAKSSAGGAIVWLGSPTGDVQEALASALFGSNEPDAVGSADSSISPLAGGVATEALAALRTALVRAMGWDEDEAEPVSVALPPAQDSRPWSGAVRIDFKIGDAMPMVLHMAASAWPSAGTPAKPLVGRPALRPVPAVLATHDLVVRALLADVPLSLGDLMSLRPGDVLVTPHRLASPLAVHLHGSSAQAPLFAGRLTQRTGHMALALRPAAECVPVETSVE